MAGCREERKHAKAKHGMAPKELCIVRFSDTLTLGTCIRGGTLHSPLLEMCSSTVFEDDEDVAANEISGVARIRDC